MRAYVYNQPRELDASQFADYLDLSRTAVLSIDMHRGHLDDSPDCPCPAPRARDVVAPIDAFHDEVRALGGRIVHVKSVLREGGADDIGGIPAAWRRTFPLHVGPIPNADAHAIEGSPWTEWVTRVEPGDLKVENKRRLSAFYPTDLDFLLRNQRIETVVLDGGFTKWVREGRETQLGHVEPIPVEFAATPRPELWVDKAYVERVVAGQEDAALVCGVPPKEFTGEIAHRARAGRIPGSISVPAGQLVDRDTRALVGTDQLRAKFQPALGRGRIVTYCGGGIAAASNALALTLLGERNVAIYDGSLNEWTADPNAPVVVGA